MNPPSRPRRWIIRDDGRLYRAGNRVTGPTEAIGMLLFVADLLPGPARAQTGIGVWWSYG